MTKYHAMSFDYQISQAKKVKRLEAQNSQLRAKLEKIKALAKENKPDNLPIILNHCELPKEIP